MPALDFEAAFKALTGNAPFPWQQGLYERFVAGDVPGSCNLPTGLGKTSVIAVWLIALANGYAVPRRLVYVVNRRTVVDQTTDEVEKYRRCLAGVGPPWPPVLQDMVVQLGQMSGFSGELLAISTLRGQFADNREWSADPSRPAVICGTVDMIGSRLLFSGYGCGKTRPLHAGFLGQDSLIVHDEAHLEPAFQELLLAIEAEQKRCQDFRPLKVMELTATSRAGGEAFGLTPADHANETVRRRINATKTVSLIENVEEKKLPDEIAALGLKFKDSGCAVLVFVRKVDDVEKVTRKLPKGTFEQLTGTLRGYERDGLVRKPIFQRFLPDSNRDKTMPPHPGTVYLVCTSAGEVGVNISADHLVCDLSTFESMAQRFGRVNRFGLRDDTAIHVVYAKEFADDDFGSRLKKTLELLRQLNGNGSPAALGGLDFDARLAAFSPPPTILPTSDILFDSWALTSIRGKLPGRPPVEPYLHGLTEWEPPETHVAWREEVGLIHGDLLAQYPAADLLEDYPLKPHELLRDNAARVFDRLKKLNAAPETPVWLVDDESVAVSTLGELIEAGKDELGGMTVLLPPSAGGLSGGFLASDSPDANDVADELSNDKGERRRVRAWKDEKSFAEKTAGLRPVRKIVFPASQDDADDEGRVWCWFERPAGGDGEGSGANKRPVLWQVHTDDVVGHAKSFLANLPLPDEMKAALVLAAEWHDLGKKRKVFQRVLGNPNPQTPWAKSGQKGSRLEEKYRHEFGSLLDVRELEAFKSLTPDMQQFVLHVIAAHHGRGRPHFAPDEAFDREHPHADAEAVARETPRRFARFQRKYGRWGLAYLESLLRAADYAASANPSQFVGDEK